MEAPLTLRPLPLAGGEGIRGCVGWVIDSRYKMCIFSPEHTHSGPAVRTNIVIDEKLMADAIKATGAKTKKEAVELGLKTLVRLKKQERIRGLRGKLQWIGDLERMRAD